MIGIKILLFSVRYGVMAASFSPRVLASFSYCVRQICRASLVSLLGKQIYSRSKPSRAARSTLYELSSFHFRSAFDLSVAAPNLQAARRANRAAPKFIKITEI